MFFLKDFYIKKNTFGFLIFLQCVFKQSLLRILSLSRLACSNIDCLVDMANDMRLVYGFGFLGVILHCI